MLQQWHGVDQPGWSVGQDRTARAGRQRDVMSRVPDPDRGTRMTHLVYAVAISAPATADLIGRLAPTLVSAVRAFAADPFRTALPRLEPGVVVIGPDEDEVSRLELLAALRGLRARFVAIAVTEPGNVAFAVQAMRAGAVDVLERTVTPERMAQVLGAARTRLAARIASAREPADARSRIEGLTRRERQVLAALVEGASNKVIAHALDLSPRTVEIHRARLMERLGARNLSDALRLAFVADAVGDG